MFTYDNFNLAPIKYKDITRGPVDKIEFKQFHWSNSSYFEAYAYLKPELHFGRSRKNKVYGNCDGTGTAKYKNEAIYKAVSEAVERWALYETCSGGSTAFGFDIESSSSGMAAFPGLLKTTAKKISYCEAVERWALVEWWSGNLGADLVAAPNGEGAQILVIKTPFRGQSVVILFKKIEIFYAYGFSSHFNFDKAVWKANTELIRNIRALTRFYNEYRSPTDLLEKRLVYFSSEIGHNLFLTNIKQSTELKKKSKVPKLIIDEEIKGPWSKFATVWRTLFANRNQNHWDNRSDVFLF